MKVCPKCGKVLSYNSYFGAYICTDCKWEDASIGEKRNKGHITYRLSVSKRSTTFSGHKVVATKSN